MEVRENVIVPLGYGKFVRSDKIIALDPIEEERGPGRRTRVYVEGIKDSMIASRTENAILAGIVEIPREVIEANIALELLQDILDDIQQIGPMLKKSIKEEAGLNLEKLEKQIEEILKHEIDMH